MRRHVAVTLAMMLLLVACAGDASGDGSTDLAGTCGFPARTTAKNVTALPPDFVFDGVEVANFEDRKSRLTAALNVPLSVQDALPRYRAASEQAGFEIIQEDNEGFEAELYMRKQDDLASIQIRGSQCRDAVRVYVNIVRDASARSG